MTRELAKREGRSWLLYGSWRRLLTRETSFTKSSGRSVWYRRVDNAAVGPHRRSGSPATTLGTLFQAHEQMGASRRGVPGDGGRVPCQGVRCASSGSSVRSQALREQLPHGKGGRARNGDFGSPVSVCDSKWKCFNSDVWKDNITPQRAVHGKLFWENVFGQRR